MNKKEKFGALGEIIVTKSLMRSSFDAVLQQRLFSYTIKINYCNPVLFYIGNRHLYKNQSFFWKSPDGDFSLVGLGAAYVLKKNDGDERFKYIENGWKQICQQAVIENPYDIPGTGPLIFGGFSFDAESKLEKEWEPFGQALFYLPKYMLTEIDGNCYMTVNTFSNSDSHNEIFEEAEELVSKLINNTATELPDPAPLVKQTELQTSEWMLKVEEIVGMLNYTDLQKVVLARKLKLEFAQNANAGYALEQLITQQPNSFIFALQAGRSCFMGASPERLVKKTGPEVLSTSLAGSIERSSNEKEDEELAMLLLKDEKNRFEHQLVVSMIENALDQYCDYINIPREPTIMKTPDIQHLYTPVSGEMKPGNTIFQIVEELHPTPALGGVPTKAAMKIICEKENMDRGFYAAPMGWSDYRMNGEFIVAIRSGLLSEKEAYLYAGCGLVTGSTPEDELTETRIKFRPMLRAIGGNYA